MSRITFVADPDMVAPDLVSCKKLVRPCWDRGWLQLAPPPFSLFRKPRLETCGFFFWCFCFCFFFFCDLLRSLMVFELIGRLVGWSACWLGWVSQRVRRVVVVRGRRLGMLPGRSWPGIISGVGARTRSQAAFVFCCTVLYGVKGRV